MIDTSSRRDAEPAAEVFRTTRDPGENGAGKHVPLQCLNSPDVLRHESFVDEGAQAPPDSATHAQGKGSCPRHWDKKSLKDERGLIEGSYVV
jgi:hypothetical protein